MVSGAPSSTHRFFEVLLNGTGGPILVDDVEVLDLASVFTDQVRTWSPYRHHDRRTRILNRCTDVDVVFVSVLKGDVMRDGISLGGHWGLLGDWRGHGRHDGLVGGATGDGEESNQEGTHGKTSSGSGLL